MASVRVRGVTFHSVPVRTRMPFRYGIAELREMPHLFVRAEVEVAGKASVGVSADNLPPKWFTKDPNATFERELADMVGVIRAAGRHAVEAGAAPSARGLSDEVYERQKAWARGTDHPPLLWGFGVSLIERAVIDVVCRARGVTFHQGLVDGELGVPLGVPIAARPLESVQVRHTVGLSDPLTGEDVAEGERLGDGLPQTLEEVIGAYGVRYFKVKLSGDVGKDRERLRRLAGLLERCCPEYAYTLDGNENFRELAGFRELWGSLAGEGSLRRFLSRLIFVEQPLHRDVALATELYAWTDRPPIIIDESDADPFCLPAALSMGYVGTSHKNCKGVFKSLRNAALLREEERRTGRRYILSGEDLTNVGPVALLQDLAVLASLGIEHAERNGHHYVRGLTPFPEGVQGAVVAAHGDLYQRHERGFSAVRIVNGRVSTRSVAAAPFGYGFEFDPRQFPELAG